MKIATPRLFLQILAVTAAAFTFASNAKSDVIFYDVPTNTSN